VTGINNRNRSDQICETLAARNASAVEPEVVMLASAYVPEPVAALSRARECFVSSYVDVEIYAGSLQLRRANLLDAVGQELRLVAAE
jgi:hypothetical protein